MFRFGNRENGWHTAVLSSSDTGIRYKIFYSFKEDFKAIFFFNGVFLICLYFIDVYESSIPDITIAVISTIIGVTFLVSFLLILFFFVNLQKVKKKIRSCLV